MRLGQEGEPVCQEYILTALHFVFTPACVSALAKRATYMYVLTCSHIWRDSVVSWSECIHSTGSWFVLRGL